MQYTSTNRIFATLVSFQYSHYERYIVMVKHSPELIEYQKDHDICRCKSRSWLGTGTQRQDINKQSTCIDSLPLKKHITKMKMTK
jgi:hypothetical protein